MNDKPVAFITGANRGLGLEISRQLERKGMTVIIAARNYEKGEQAVKMLRHETTPDMRAYTSFSSQEPCPMCMIRLITSGIGKICYVYRDAGSPDQKDVKSIDRLPPVWGELAQRQEIVEAECSPELKEMAHQAFLLSASAAAEKIRNR